MKLALDVFAVAAAYFGFYGYVFPEMLLRAEMNFFVAFAAACLAVAGPLLCAAFLGYRHPKLLGKDQ